MENLTDIEQGKTSAIVAYFTFIGWLIGFFMNKENRSDFAAFHLRQALGIHVLALILNPTVSWLNNWWFSATGWGILFIFWLITFIGVLQKKRKPVPFFGKAFEKWFHTITE